MNHKLLSQFTKTLLPIAIILVGFTLVHGQDLKINFEAERSVSSVTVNDYESTRIQFAFDGLDFIDVKTQKGTFSELIMPGGYSVGDFGTPKLPALKKLIEIPFGAEVHVEVLSYTTEHYLLSDFGVEHPLMPAQPSLRKDMDVSEVPFEYQPEYYARKSYIEPGLASIEVLGVMRAQRIGHLTVAPVQYNPSEGTIKVYNNIELEIQYTGADEQLTRYMKASTYSPYFDVVYNQVINPYDAKDIFDDHPDLTKYPVKMIIVSHDMFEETLQPFIQWKTIQGFEVIEAYTSEIGSTASAIQSFIHDQYAAGTPEDPAPTFVVVVGAPNLLPASAIGSSSNQVTDLYYGSVDGDVFPEMYVGRLSARNTQELQNQLDKILYYQQYEFEDPSYLNDVTLIAGQDNFWNPAIGQPTVHYGTQNYFNAANGFTNVNAYLNTYTGVYDEERIAVSMINFTAHCLPTLWSSPTLTAADIHNLTNTNRYPLAVGNCCQSALFSQAESIGEAWLRAENKGAVAYIGSAPNTHWFEDFYWAVGAFQISGQNNGYVPTVEETTMGVYDAIFNSDYHPVAAKKFVGNLALTEAHMQNYPTHSSYPWYWQGYHTFGDPSTIIYFTEGSENEVSHMPIVPIGLEIYTVEALPGSYVAISMNGVLHGAALVGPEGEVDVPIEPILDGGDVTIVVTKPQYIPYRVEVPAAALEGPFIVIDEFIINDPHGINTANYGESFTIDLTLKNVGADPSAEVTASLSGGDQYIFMDDGNAPVVFEAMEADETGNTATVPDAFAFHVSMDILNNHQTSFLLHITDGEEEWTSNLSITGYAPVFEINPEYVLDDSIDGDGNGRLDPGETAHIAFELTNSGGTAARNPVMELMANSPYFSIEESEIELPSMQPGRSMEVTYVVTAHASAPQGTLVDLEVAVEDGHHVQSEYSLIIGQSPEMTLGDGTLESVHFPFYNYYKANRSQMIYLASELGAGEKSITEIAFEITQAATQFNQLPNFVVRMMHTSASSLSNFLNTNNAEEVYTANPHVMPTSTGWHHIELDEYFEHNGTENLLVEIVWGQLPNWTLNHFKVASTQMGANMVAYGYSDWVDVPGFNGTSGVRPNLFLAFATDDTENAHHVEFLIKNTEGNPLENAAVIIGSLAKHTNADGLTSFELLPGIYDFSAAKTGFQGFENDFTLGDEGMLVEVVLYADDDDTIIPGDANCDGSVDALDIITIINYFLDADPDPFCFENADINQDGIVDILDLIGTINIFSQGKLYPYPGLVSEKASLFLTSTGIELHSDGTLTGVQFEITGVKPESFSMEIDLPDHNIVHKRMEDKIVSMIYSINNTAIPEGIISLVGFDNEMELLNWGDRVLAVNLNTRSVPVTTHMGTTDIQDLSLEEMIRFSAFPNPANDVLWVNFYNQSDQPVSITLLNIHGQSIEQLIVDEQGFVERSFNLDNLRPGLYLLRLNYERNQVIKKILVK